MRAELNVIELIEKYALGIMEENEKSLFENRLNSDEQLKVMTEFQLIFAEGIQNYGLKNAAKLAYRRYNLKLWIKGFAVLFFLLLTVYSIFILTNYFSDRNDSMNLKNNPSTEEQFSMVGVDSVNTHLNYVDANTQFDTLSVTVQEVSQKQRQLESRVVNTDVTGSNSNIDTCVDENVWVSENLVNKFESGIKNDVKLSVQQSEETHEWRLDWRTTNSDLKRIQEEIEREGGKLTVRNIKYRGEMLRQIDFTVTSKKGEVEYHSPNLSDDIVICIVFSNSGISVGPCNQNKDKEGASIQEGNSTITNSLNDEFQIDSINVHADMIETELLDPGKRKFKRTRFFSQSVKFDSGRKRNSIRSRKKFF